MNLSSLLSSDREAVTLYQSLPEPVQNELSQRGGNITSLAALREYANNLIAHTPVHNSALLGVNSGIPLDTELSAEWAMEHES